MAGCWKDYRAHEKGHKSPLDKSSLSLSCGSCSADWLTCFSLSLACKGKREVLEATQQCPQCLVHRTALLLLEGNALGIEWPQSPGHGSTFVPSHLIDIHSRGLSGWKSLSLILLSILPFSYILLDLFYPLSKVWRSCWIWLSNSFFMGQHREEEHWMLSFYTDRLVAKLLWVLFWQTFCLNCILPHTSSQQYMQGREKSHPMLLTHVL